VLRGTVAQFQGDGVNYEHAVFQEGTQSAFFTVVRGTTTPGKYGVTAVYLDWILGLLTSILFTINELTRISESPMAEFSVGLQVTCQDLAPMAVLNDDTGDTAQLPNLNCILPTYTFLPDRGFVPLLNDALTDILNSMGMEHNDLIVAVD